MNKSRKISLINMFINLSVIGLELTGLYFTFVAFKDNGISNLKFYTVLTGLITLIAASLMIWANIVSFIKKKDTTPRLFFSMRFISAVMNLLTLLTVVFVLRNSVETNILFGIESGGLFLHAICPALSIIQFVGFEIEPKAKFKKTFEPFIVTALYAVGIIISVFVIKAKDGVEAAKAFAPYPFFLLSPDLAGDDFIKNLITAFVVLGASYVLSVIIWLLNRMFHAIFIGEAYQPVSSTNKKVTPKKTTTVNKGNMITSYVKKKVAFNNEDATPTGGQVYHISYHDRRLKTWKVKSENAGRALKVFPTQKEAIDFANEQVKKNGGSIRVHSMMGQIRKE